MPENYIWLKFDSYLTKTKLLSHVTPKRHLAARGGSAAARRAPRAALSLFTIYRLARGKK